jgi:hypothetical protein
MLATHSVLALGALPKAAVSLAPVSFKVTAPDKATVYLRVTITLAVKKSMIILFFHAILIRVAKTKKPTNSV